MEEGRENERNIVSLQYDLQERESRGLKSPRYRRWIDGVSST